MHLPTRYAVVLGSLLCLLTGPLHASPWVLQDVLVPVSDPVTPKTFGSTGPWMGKAISIRGDKIAIGARAVSPSGAGSVYVFHRDASQDWNEVAYLQATPGRPDFGGSVAISTDFLVVGAPSRNGSQLGEFYAYHLGANGSYTPTPYLTNGIGLTFSTGSVTALTDTRWVVNHVDNIMPMQLNVFNQDPYLALWEADQPPIFPPRIARFGTSVALSGDTLAVGEETLDSNRAGAAYVTDMGQNGVWGDLLKFQSPNPTAGDEFGELVDLDGDRLIISASNDQTDPSGTGAAYIYARNSLGQWELESRLAPSVPITLGRFGTSVAISGDYALVGANTAEAYFFHRTVTGDWVEVQKLTNPRINEGIYGFGGEVDIDGETAIIGGNGKVYVYVIPEPATAGIIALGLGALAATKRRSYRRA